MNVGSVAAGGQEIVRPRLQSGASGRPLNFTVRRRPRAVHFPQEIYG